MSKVLFIAPHPDDEVFGCGGVIAKHRANGDAIFWLISSTGYESEGFSPDSLQVMNKQIGYINEYFQFNAYKRLKFPSAKLDSVPMIEIVSSINEFIGIHQPDTIYVNHREDVHTDHKVVFDAVWSCCKSFRNPFIKSVYVYEVLSETEYSNPSNPASFLPNTFHDISKYIENKKIAIKLYSSEIEPHPHPRSISSVEMLAKLRGSTVNLEYAEAFMCIKKVL
jgi:N-acetylglucosamine malate deacetylase 1